MAKVYLDESGYTGEDLIHPDQPVFVIATHSIDEASCDALKARHFAGIKATELKHSRLASRPRQAKMLISALTDLTTNFQDKILVAIANKRYSLLCKIVDLVIETSMHQAGFDLYPNGGNIAMANVMYACMDLDRQYLDRVLRAFQKWMRQRNIERQFELNHVLARPHPIDSVDHFRKWIFGALLSLRYVGVFRGLGRGALDLSFPTAINVMGMWREKLGDETIDLVHDQSSNMAKQKQLWDLLVGTDAPPAMVGFDSRTVQFPLGIRETCFVDGRTNSSLQIADIISGSTATLAASQITGASSDYISDLKAVFTGGGFYGYQYLPSLDYTPEALGTVGPGGVDPLEYIGKLMEAANLVPKDGT